MENDDVCIIGRPYTEFSELPQVFQLIIEEHLNIIDPTKYGLNITKFDPLQFYITSGDAIEKTKYVLTRLEDLAIAALDIIRSSNNLKSEGALKNYLNIQSKHSDCIKEINQNITSCHKLLDLLRQAKGDSIFLETEWNNHRLLCIPKNPRKAML